mmetsp:Transcript_48868/g.139934  ORF Transcript_48868/g.139934 Transcript_48868/m.139934 type:complete len:381 (+) Transcript_48868:115-1257(+)
MNARLDVAKRAALGSIASESLLEGRARGVVHKLPAARWLEEAGALGPVLVGAAVLTEGLCDPGRCDAVVLGDPHDAAGLCADPAEVRAEEVAQRGHGGETLGRCLAGLVALCVATVVHDGVVLGRKHERGLQPGAGPGSEAGHGDQHVGDVPQALQGHAAGRVARHTDAVQVQVAVQDAEANGRGILERCEYASGVAGLVRPWGHDEVHDAKQVVELDARMVRCNHHEASRRPVCLMVQGCCAERCSAMDHQQHREGSVCDGQLSEALARLACDIGCVDELLPLSRRHVIPDVVGQPAPPIFAAGHSRVPNLHREAARPAEHTICDLDAAQSCANRVGAALCGIGGVLAQSLLPWTSGAGGHGRQGEGPRAPHGFRASAA